jgi:vacuolar-type H+-ATPase subunit H
VSGRCTGERDRLIAGSRWETLEAMKAAEELLKIIVTSAKEVFGITRGRRTQGKVDKKLEKELEKAQLRFHEMFTHSMKEQITSAKKEVSHNQKLQLLEVLLQKTEITKVRALYISIFQKC